MAMSEAELRGILTEENYEYRKLVKQHQGFEEKLEEFRHRPHLTANEQTEVTILKKAKLKVKDRMEQILREHKEDH